MYVDESFSDDVVDNFALTDSGYTGLGGAGQQFVQQNRDESSYGSLEAEDPTRFLRDVRALDAAGALLRSFKRLGFTLPRLQLSFSRKGLNASEAHALWQVVSREGMCQGSLHPDDVSDFRNPASYPTSALRALIKCRWSAIRKSFIMAFGGLLVVTIVVIVITTTATRVLGE